MTCGLVAVYCVRRGGPVLAEYCLSPTPCLIRVPHGAVLCHGVLPSVVLQMRYVDPVLAADGCTYERKHMQLWLRANDTSPVTGQPLEHKHLVPNIVIRDM